MTEILFLTLEDVLYIQNQEATLTNSPTTIRDLALLESSIAAPKATFEGDYLMDLFEMAATYVVSISVNHPFLDGNKRTAAASSLVFLYLNGFEVIENHEYEFADLVLGFLNKLETKSELANYFRQNSRQIN
jgi:death-on-curing protein